MPIWLRRFTFKRLKDYYAAKNTTSTTPQDPAKILKPAISPKSDYKTTLPKATRK